MNTLIKMAPILHEFEFAKILPIAWELLLAKDQDRVASAASIIILCSGEGSVRDLSAKFGSLANQNVVFFILQQCSCFICS